MLANSLWDVVYSSQELCLVPEEYRSIVIVDLTCQLTSSLSILAPLPYAFLFSSLEIIWFTSLKHEYQTASIDKIRYLFHLGGCR
jgi:hypothetical protein